MKNRFAAPVASAATALMLLGACSDAGPTTLAKGEDVELVGDTDLGGQTLNISAEEEDGKPSEEPHLKDFKRVFINAYIVEEEGEEWPFEEGCLEFHTNDRAVRTASSEQVPIISEIINRTQPGERNPVRRRTFRVR